MSISNNLIKRIRAPTYHIDIYIAGDYDMARQIVREFCDEFGACFTVTKTVFEYTDGEESGVIVGLIHYPRFPVNFRANGRYVLEDKAIDLAEWLIYGLGQDSASVETPHETIWLTRRSP